ncbi:uncharacterized oxidoreductase YjmC-like [Euwallacea similis]|uniref:uncharacterized oxidoreductase YjmC-like n=1 Tax=Euwallacea similis TaxID=1736056 RepID=UPI00344F7103
MEDKVLVTTLEEAKRFMLDCFQTVGVSGKHANIVAENLLTADYRGHFSHGMNRLNWYINDIITKSVDPNMVPSIEKQTIATALVNGNNTLGAVVGEYCMGLAIEKAKGVGIGMVTAFNSNHYGIAGIYSLQAMKARCIGISLTNASPVLVPTRAKEQALGTNPISFGVPGMGDESMLLDMATTTVAMGKLELHLRQNKPLPEGWSMNNAGDSETDPLTAIKSHKLFPLGGTELTGGYKGYGLSLMVEILCGILSGSSYGPNIPMWYPEGRNKKADLSHIFIAIDPTVFAPGYDVRLNDLMSHIRNIEPRNPDKPVLVPGDPEKNHMNYVDLQGGLCYIQNQHETNKILAEKLSVIGMRSKVLDKIAVKE